MSKKKIQCNSSERLLTKDSESLNQDTKSKNRVTEITTGEIGIGKELGRHCADSCITYYWMNLCFFSFRHVCLYYSISSTLRLGLGCFLQGFPASICAFTQK